MSFDSREAGMVVEGVILPIPIECEHYLGGERLLDRFADRPAPVARLAEVEGVSLLDFEQLHGTLVGPGVMGCLSESEHTFGRLGNRMLLTGEPGVGRLAKVLANPESNNQVGVSISLLL